MREKLAQYKSANVQTAFDTFVKRREKLHSGQRWIGKLSRYAAIFIVPVLAVVFYYSQRENVEITEQPQSKSGVFTIQRNLPVLTLSNGKEMVLYNQELLLEEENGVRISVNEEGRMQYDRADSVGTEMVYNTLTTPSQCDFTFTLADGTKVWMNAKSSLRYPVAFQGRERVVYAEGEIYLEVARDEKHPFFVMLNGMKVEVLGTSFNVNSYADENYTEVTLVEGHVAAYVDDKNYDLLPSRQLRWDKENERILLTSGTAYETVGGELADSSTAVEKIGKSTSTIVLDGEKIALDGYIINGNNYYKLRDIGKAIGFDVDFDNASSTVLVKTTSDYSGDDEDANSGNSSNTGSNTTPTVTNPTSYTFNGSGWGHSVGMSQWGAYAMAQKGFTYDQILKFYFTGIEIAE